MATWLQLGTKPPRGLLAAIWYRTVRFDSATLVRSVTLAVLVRAVFLVTWTRVRMTLTLAILLAMARLIRMWGPILTKQNRLLLTLTRNLIAFVPWQLMVRLTPSVSL